MPLDKETKARIIKTLRDRGIKEAPEQKEVEWDEVPPEGDYEANPAYAEEAISKRFEAGKLGEAGRMKDMNVDREEIQKARNEKLRRARRMYEKMGMFDIQESK